MKFSVYDFRPVIFNGEQMKIELQNKLFEKYPKIFRQKDLPKTETCMCWGIACPDKWYDLIDALCKQIQMYVNQQRKALNRTKSLISINDYPQVEATQVKIKFGGLRFYHDHHSEYVRGLVSMAEAMSYNIKLK